MNDRGFVWLLAGAAAGAVAGLLLAPQTGRKTRREVRKAANDATYRVKRASREVLDRSQDVVDDTVRLVRRTARSVGA